MSEKCKMTYFKIKLKFVQSNCKNNTVKWRHFYPETHETNKPY